MARGYFTQGQGNPDESRASRYILKDYVSAKLLYSHPPPGLDADEFNAETRELVTEALARTRGGKRAPVNRVGKKSHTFIPEVYSEGEDAAHENGDMAALVSTKRPQQSTRANALDKNFFLNSGVSSRMFINGANAPSNSASISRGAMYAYQNRLDENGKKLSGRKMRELESIGAITASSSKKHNKANKRTKARSGGGYE